LHKNMRVPYKNMSVSSKEKSYACAILKYCTRICQTTAEPLTYNIYRRICQKKIKGIKKLRGTDAATINRRALEQVE